MTPTQRNFRKEIQSCEGKLKEDFRTTRKRPTFSKGISIISIVFLLWNSFALLTWISPSAVHKIKDFINPNSSISNQFISSDQIDSKAQRVSNYFLKLKTVTEDIENIINKINQSYRGEVYSKDSILEDINKLTNLEMYVLTPDDEFKDLEFIELKIISLTKNMITNLYHNRDIDYETESRAQKWDKLRQDKRREMINILDKNGFKYEVNQDGSMRYWK